MRLRQWDPEAVRAATVALPAVAVATYAMFERVRIRRVPRLPEAARGLDAVFSPDSLPADQPRPGAAATEPISMVTIGDSVTSGVGASAAARSCPGVLAQLVATALDRPVRVRSLGRTGARAEDVRTEQIPWLGELGHVDVVVVAVGANDATHLTPPERFTGQLAALCDEARAGTGAPVLLTGTPEFRSTRALGLPLRTLAWLCGQGLHERQRELAADRDGVHFVDVLADVSTDFRQDPGFIAHDGYHPSDRGAARLAEAIMPAVVTVLDGHPGSGDRSARARPLQGTPRM